MFDRVLNAPLLYVNTDIKTKASDLIFGALSKVLGIVSKKIYAVLIINFEHVFNSWW